MDINASCPLAAELAARIRHNREELTKRWLDRIAARVSIDPNRIFPTDQLLDHVPILMEGIADYIEDPAEEISADVPVIAKAMELGTLRHNQGFDAHEILKEYEILGGVLFNFVAHEVEAVPGKVHGKCTDAELLIFSHRLFRAVSVIAQATTSHYLRVMNEKVSGREEQLRRFNRMVSHELKNKVGAVMGAGELLAEDWLPDVERRKFIDIVLQNARDLQQVLENLTQLSRLDGESRRQRNIMLREAVLEVIRQQREMARTRSVEIEIDDLPRVEVNAAAVELCLSNYLSNAVKYSNPNAPARWVRIAAETGDTGDTGEMDDGTQCHIVVRVTDNGMGVPHEQREKLFQRFFRAENVGENEGTGLGLSLVRETLEAIGGNAWAEFDSGQTVFAFSMPCRRRGEARGKGTPWSRPSKSTSQAGD